MTNSESLIQFGNNAYAKTATSLNILRETVMGRELFDYAFKTYAQRWAFKHPTPADFFRTMEDASAVDLDWFWRGWYYTIDNVDIALTEVKYYTINTQNPEVESAHKKDAKENEPMDIGTLRQQDAPPSVVEQDETMRDYYDTRDEFAFDALDQKQFENYQANLTKAEKAILDSNFNYYALKFELIGGLVMPLIIQFEFEDGTNKVVRIPAEIWRKKNTTATKLFWFDQKVTKVVLDPYLETADIDRSNNVLPKVSEPTKFDLYKARKQNKHQAIGENPMQRAKRAKEVK